MRRTAVLFIVTMCFLTVKAQQVSYCPLDMNGISAIPYAISTPSHDVMWVGMFGTGANCNLYAITTDAGATFTMDTVPDPARNNMTLFALNKDTAWAGLTDIMGSNGGAVWKTTDGGTNWTRQTTTEFNGSGSYLDWLYFCTPDTGVVLGDPVGGAYEIYTTVNGGTTWTAVNAANIPAPLSGEWGLNDYYSGIGQRVWCGTNKGRVLYSFDCGLNWTAVTINAAYTMINVSMNDANNGIAWQVNSNTPYVTSDGGVTWAPKPLSPVMAVDQISAIKNVSGAFVFKSMGHGIYATSDNFTSYVLVDNAHPVNSNPLRMFDATIGWTQRPVQNSDSGIIRIANIPLGVFSPEANSHQISVFPNPATSGGAMLSFDAEQNSDATLCIYDPAGRMVVRQSIAVAKGRNAIALDLGLVMKGLYLLSVTDGMRTSNLKLIVN